MRTLGFTRIREGVGSTHQGILGTYTTNFGVNITSSKVEHCTKADDTIYQRHYVSKGRFTRLLNMKDIVGSNPTKDLVVHKESDVSISIHPEEERMQGD